MERNSRSYIRKVRYIVQWAIFSIVIYAGFNLYQFMTGLKQSGVPPVNHPSSVEGFLPIGALMALKLWIAEGIFDPVHPAGLVIFIGALLLAVLLKKSFCSWICPVGTFSDGVWRLGKGIFGRNFVIPKYMDYALRSIKYIIMALSLYAVFIKMPASKTEAFLNTSFWKVSDIKLLRFFFVNITPVTKITLIVLFVLSIFYKNFWCRYLCPYGGLLGMLSFFSPLKITRIDSKCIHCGLCSKNCPSYLPVDIKRVVRSPECTGCLTCVSHCPSKGALDVAFIGKKAISPEIVMASIVAIFFGIVLIAQVAGKWHSVVSYDELFRIMPFIDTLAHP